VGDLLIQRSNLRSADRPEPPRPLVSCKEYLQKRTPAGRIIIAIHRIPIHVLSSPGIWLSTGVAILTRLMPSMHRLLLPTLNCGDRLFRAWRTSAYRPTLHLTAVSRLIIAGAIVNDAGWPSLIVSTFTHPLNCTAATIVDPTNAEIMEQHQARSALIRNTCCSVYYRWTAITISSHRFKITPLLLKLLSHQLYAIERTDFQFLLFIVKALLL
jgi:hypothetical protein